jgi:predicted RNA-binding Zn-ribbon protein involved in translation (DUF1610 family)
MAVSSDMAGYSQPVAAYVENRTLNRLEEPRDLLADVGRALNGKHLDATLNYEHRYIKIHYPTRLCPSCGDVVRLKVVANSDTRERTRICPECGVIGRDEHIGAEVRQIIIDSGSFDRRVFRLSAGGGRND